MNENLREKERRTHPEDGSLDIIMLWFRGVVEGAAAVGAELPPPNGAPVLMASDSRVKPPLSAAAPRADPGGLQVSQQLPQLLVAEGAVVEDHGPVAAHNTTTPALLPSIPPL